MSKTNEYTLVVRMDADTKAKLERWSDPGDRTEFARTAIRFYADCLAIHDNDLLPKAIVSAIDGRLTLLEQRLSALSFRQALAQDMTNGILADAFEFTRDELRQRRAESVKNVKRTNGFISLEKRVNEGTEFDFDEDKDEWQS